MNKPQNIFLIGPMGAGKTTVGRQLAKQLHQDFYDSDREIERICGVSIPTIFEFEGEAGFREREAKMLDTLTQQHPIVLATGGGSVLRPENRTVMSERGFVVYLSINLREQFARIRHDKNRPLLQTENPRETLRRIMLERSPLYESLADLRINSNGRNMRYVVEKILKRLPPPALTS
ncbi:MAG TPA: shikimate kinase AroK [Gammaproteobacteria bacterium]|jgi:shikimate kinase|nr:shikimate kinase AroK [Gammaproteobacteria bacterium]